MDPPSRVFEAAPLEIWPFPPAAADTGAMPWMHPRSPRMVPRGHGSGFAEVGGHRDAASVGESTVTEQSCGIRSGNELMEYEAKYLKAGGSRDENGESKAEVEASSGICSKLTDQGAQHSEAPKQDYIHVRARRGQATDSHSLAERARREKISERMKILQDLVPGCNKVIGKALVLDEIINYVQSLQHQVEFLSMKLEALSSQTNPSVEGFRAKDVRRTDAD